MPGILQEKFQVDYPQERNDDEHSGWITDKQARAKKGVPGREGSEGGDSGSQRMNNAALFHTLPPGMDIEDQEMTDQRKMDFCMSGESDVSKDWNPQAQITGFTRKPMRATDDEYSNAHVDAFYDEITVEGDTGFVERNNVLDRL